MPDTDDSPPETKLSAAERLAQAQAALRALEAAEGGRTGRAQCARPAPLCPLAPMTRPLTTLQQMTLARGRVHELTGSARHTLAVLTAAAAAREGPVLWLRPGWRTDTLCPQGVRALTGPGVPLLDALILADCPREGDILWAMEEGLRAGCVALVVAEIGTPPDLRQIRRLHLAAAEGLAGNGPDGGRTANGGAPGIAPLGLLLAQERADSRIAGVESRWALQALPPEPAMPPGGRLPGNGPRWKLERLRARQAPPAEWVIDCQRMPAAPQIAAPVTAPARHG
ncbi:MAG: hypothetical protein ACXIVG_04490 [Pararhodobacter sp.]